VSKVAWSDGKLQVVVSDEQRFEMIPLAADRFAVQTPWFGVEVTFKETVDDKLQMSFLIDGATEARVYEKYVPREPSPQDLEAYAGTYFSDELGVSYALDVEEGALVFRIVRHEANTLTPLFGEIFSNSDYGTFEFKRGPDGAVGGFVLDAGRVRNLEFKRQNGDGCR
jgi:hypothetical protein